MRSRRLLAAFALLAACQSAEPRNRGAQLSGGAGGAGGDFGLGAGGGVPASCGHVTAVAPLAPLDLYLVFDRSGSMAGARWDAAAYALKTFVNHPRSAGLGVGLQFFPRAGAFGPAPCAADNDCGLGGFCRRRHCNAGPAIACAGDADCGALGPCVDDGACELDSTTWCEPADGACAGDLGACLPIAEGVCLDVCEPAAYASPALPIVTLPEGAPAIAAAITVANPDGHGTPMGPALQGAVRHARTWASAKSDHVAAVLLVTDGMPSGCSPIEPAAIAALAADGLVGTPSVRTFVIGILGSEPSAAATLDGIAAAGGTEKAFILEPPGTLADQFLDVLEAIRGSRPACEYDLPTPPAGAAIDYDDVDVRATPAHDVVATSIPRVKSAAACGAAGGWHYDVEPDSGAPSKILLCAASCAALDPASRVDIRVGCEADRGGTPH